MKTKWLLYIGIVLLTIGIIFKILNIKPPISLAFILSGITFKIIYISSKIVSKEYKPGYEIIFFIIGLILFFGSMFLHKHGYISNPMSYKIIGITLKITFVIFFIRKVQKSKVRLT